MEFLELELDILSEIGNVSVGGAATSLSDFVKKMVTISIPKTTFRTFAEIKNEFEPTAIATRVNYIEGFSGSNVLLIKKEDAIAFSNLIAKEKLGTEVTQWNTLAKNILEEVFNIMVGTMSSQMSLIFDRNVRIDLPIIYERKPDDLDFYDDKQELCEIAFILKIEDEMKLKIMKLMNKQQATMMVDIIKGIHQI